MKHPKPSYVLKLRREIKAMKQQQYRIHLPQLPNIMSPERLLRYMKTTGQIFSSNGDKPLANQEWLDSFEKLPYIDKP